MTQNETTLEQALAAQVRVELASRDWSQKELAAKIGIGRDALGNYMRNDRHFPLPTLIAIAEAFDLETGELVGRAERRRDE